MNNKTNSFKIEEITNRVVRRNYSKIDSNFVGPDLLQSQIDSYKKFLSSELEGVIKNISPIIHGKYQFKINGISLQEPRFSEEDSLNNGITYSAPLYVDVELYDSETGEVTKLDKTGKKKANGIFFGDIPLMTKKATFIINGIEKVIVSQIVRSPGAYALSKAQIRLSNARKRIIEGKVCEVLPYRGSLMIIAMMKDAIKGSKTKQQKLQVIFRDSMGDSAPIFTVTHLLKAFGVSTNEIRNIYGDSFLIDDCLENDIINETFDNYESSEEWTELKTYIKNNKLTEPTEEDFNIYIERGYKIEKLIKKLFVELYYLENIKNDLIARNQEKSKDFESIKSKYDEVIKKIIVEKSAKVVVTKTNISAKVFDNNKHFDDQNISYQTLLWLHFFSERYYNITSAGRYKINNKMRVSQRIFGKYIAEDIYGIDGEIKFPRGTYINHEQLISFKNLSKEGKLDIIKNISLANNPLIKEDDKYFKKLKYQYEVVSIYEDNEKNDIGNKDIRIIGTLNSVENTTLQIADLLAIISYNICMNVGIGEFDDIDHIGNKRLKLVHELLKNKINAGMIRIEKYIKEKLAVLDGGTNINQNQEENVEVVIKVPSIKTLVNTKTFQVAVKEFFNSHPLIQFIDQQNPLSELTNKRRISAMGPNGISRDDPNLDVRDVHYSYYGRICPIETPEGMNIGLVMSLASFTKVDDRGFLITPYYKVVNGQITDKIHWLTALQDDEYIISESGVKIDDNKNIIQSTVVARYRGSSEIFSPKEVDFIDVLPKQVVSIASSIIPFLENDDGNRALMGANMQRQSIPLINPYAPVIGTGSEYIIAHDSGMAIISEVDGEVVYSDSTKIIVRDKDNVEHESKLIKYVKTNQSTCNNQKTIVRVGEQVKKNDVIADGPAMKSGELSLGQNVIVAFTTWRGYNYEDAIIISDRLVKDDVYTSISIDEYTIKCSGTKNGDEEITREIPNVSEAAKKYLDNDGIIMIGSEVRENDILVGKTTPRGKIDLSPEEKLLEAIFGEKTKPIKDSSLKVPYSGAGVVASVKRFRSSDNSHNLGDDIIEIIKVYVVQKRKIQIGDKMAGRHGNKGIVSIIVPSEDMPFMPDGTPIDIMLNPLGVPSRMNIGQIFELHLGISAREIAKKKIISLAMDKKTKSEDYRKLFDLHPATAENLLAELKAFIKDKGFKSEEEALAATKTIDINIILSKVGISYDDIGYKMATPVFCGATREDLENTMIEAGIDPFKTKGKFKLTDGKTGETFDGDISVGLMYMLKLDHMVDDKIHARSVGPYSKITQQPLGGKSQNGGQRFGEMEVWALEAYGAAHNLKEILTIKSDDVNGRNKAYSAIIKGQPIPTGNIPESFKLLIKQMQGLCLRTTVIDSDGVKQDTNDFIKNQNLRNSIYDYEPIKKPENQWNNDRKSTHEDILEQEKVFNRQIFENISEQSEINENISESNETTELGDSNNENYND